MVKLFLPKIKGNYRAVYAFLIVSFLLTSLGPGFLSLTEGPVQAASLPNSLVTTTSAFNTPFLRGIKIDAADPFKFDFIVDEGDKKYSQQELTVEATTLIRYFLASLTIPENDLWVNLSPYEQNRIIPSELGSTDMGQDLLSQDYLLKQLASSLTYPESPLGKQFWDKVYASVKQALGNKSIPIGTFNKIWIVPDKIKIYEDDNKAVIGEATLKVMMEEDYLALQRNSNQGAKDKVQPNKSSAKSSQEASKLSSAVMKEIIIPVIEEEVNRGKNFAALRQIYHSLILAHWFKAKLKSHLINQVYSDKKKIKGVDAKDPAFKEKIYQSYVEAYKQGAYNYSRRFFDLKRASFVRRRYYSGGARFTEIGKTMVSSPLANLPAPFAASPVANLPVTLTPASSPVDITPEQTAKWLKVNGIIGQFLEGWIVFGVKKMNEAGVFEGGFPTLEAALSKIRETLKVADLIALQDKIKTKEDLVIYLDLIGENKIIGLMGYLVERARNPVNRDEVTVTLKNLAEERRVDSKILALVAKVAGLEAQLPSPAINKSEQFQAPAGFILSPTESAVPPTKVISLAETQRILSPDVLLAAQELIGEGRKTAIVTSRDKRTGIERLFANDGIFLTGDTVIIGFPGNNPWSLGLEYATVKREGARGILEFNTKDSIITVAPVSSPAQASSPMQLEKNKFQEVVYRGPIELWLGRERKLTIYSFADLPTSWQGLLNEEGQFFLIDDNVQPNRQLQGAKVLRYGEVVSLGRADQKIQSRFSFDKYVSSNHVRMEVRNRNTIFLQDVSLNGTWINGADTQEVKHQTPSGTAGSISSDNANMILSQRFLEVLNQESLGGNAGGGFSAVNGMVDKQGRIVIFGNPQELPKMIQEAYERGEVFIFTVKTNIVQAALTSGTPEYQISLGENFYRRETPQEVKNALKSTEELVNQLARNQNGYSPSPIVPKAIASSPAQASSPVDEGSKEWVEQIRERIRVANEDYYAKAGVYMREGTYVIEFDGSKIRARNDYLGPEATTRQMMKVKQIVMDFVERLRKGGLDIAVLIPQQGSDEFSIVVDADTHLTWQDIKAMWRQLIVQVHQGFSYERILEIEGIALTEQELVALSTPEIRGQVEGILDIYSVGIDGREASTKIIFDTRTDSGKIEKFIIDLLARHRGKALREQISGRIKKEQVKPVYLVGGVTRVITTDMNAGNSEAILTKVRIRADNVQATGKAKGLINFIGDQEEESTGTIPIEEIIPKPVTAKIKSQIARMREQVRGQIRKIKEGSESDVFKIDQLFSMYDRLSLFSVINRLIDHPNSGPYIVRERPDTFWVVFYEKGQINLVCLSPAYYTFKQTNKEIFDVFSESPRPERKRRLVEAIESRILSGSGYSPDDISPFVRAKGLNDAFGHEGADSVLMALAWIIHDNFSRPFTGPNALEDRLKAISEDFNEIINGPEGNGFYSVIIAAQNSLSLKELRQSRGKTSLIDHSLIEDVNDIITARIFHWTSFVSSEQRPRENQARGPPMVVYTPYKFIKDNLISYDSFDEARKLRDAHAEKAAAAIYTGADNNYLLDRFFEKLEKDTEQDARVYTGNFYGYWVPRETTATPQIHLVSSTKTGGSSPVAASSPVQDESELAQLTVREDLPLIAGIFRDKIVPNPQDPSQFLQTVFTSYQASWARELIKHRDLAEKEIVELLYNLRFRQKAVIEGKGEDISIKQRLKQVSQKGVIQQYHSPLLSQAQAQRQAWQRYGRIKDDVDEREAIRNEAIKRQFEEFWYFVGDTLSLPRYQDLFLQDPCFIFRLVGLLYARKEAAGFDYILKNLAGDGEILELLRDKLITKEEAKILHEKIAQNLISWRNIDRTNPLTRDEITLLSNIETYLIVVLSAPAAQPAASETSKVSSPLEIGELIEQMERIESSPASGNKDFAMLAFVDGISDRLARESSLLPAVVEAFNRSDTTDRIRMFLAFIIEKASSKNPVIKFSPEQIAIFGSWVAKSSEETQSFIVALIDRASDVNRGPASSPLEAPASVKKGGIDLGADKMNMEIVNQSQAASRTPQVKFNESDNLINPIDFVIEGLTFRILKVEKIKQLASILN